jgi:Carboxypeptidase regulatory-like domain
MLKAIIRLVENYLLFAILTCGLLAAQMTTTGTIAGTGIDSSGHAIASAKVTVTSERTSEVRTAVSNEAGAFSINVVQPDTCNLRIEQHGFKIHERRDVVVVANERVAIGDVILQIGDVTETISVVGQAAQVQTDSSEHSAVLTSNQITNLTARGREVVSMLRTIPGVQYQSDQDSAGGTSRKRFRSTRFPTARISCRSTRAV